MDRSVGTTRLDCGQREAAVPLNSLLITFGSLSERETAIFVAKDYGIFNKHGLDVRAVHVRNGAVALSALANGEAQFYMGAATGSTLGAIANGMDAVFVTSLIHTLEGTFVVNPAIKTPADLKRQKHRRHQHRRRRVDALDAGVRTLGPRAAARQDYFARGRRRVVARPGDAQQSDRRRLFQLHFRRRARTPGFRVLADLAKLNIPYQNTALLAQRKYLNSAPDTVERLLRALSDTVAFVLDPKNKSLVLQSMAKGLRLTRVEDAVSGYDRLGNMYQRRIFPNVDGIRSTIRFLGATNDKIRVLKAEELVDERFVKKLEQEGRF